MKKITAILVMLTLISCSVNYPVTTFYAKNNSDKTLNFKASIMKHNTMGQFQMTLPFTVRPHDSVLARQVGLRKGVEPTAWFKSFIIFPTDSIVFNNPNDAANWIKSIDAKGRPIYTFTMTK